LEETGRIGNSAYYQPLTLQGRMTISKTTFLELLYCPSNIWLKLHKPELLKHFVLSEFEKHLLEQGNEVESYARNLFPGGIEVVGTGEEACHETVRLMTAKVPSIFQATFIVDGFLARNDALVFDAASSCWDLYEVKGTNSIKENGPDHDHIDDLAFQASVLKRAGIPIGKYFLVHLNKEYVRLGELDLNALFVKEDQTEKVLARLPKTEEQMEAAKEYLNSEKEPTGGCDCLYQGRSKHCTTFSHSNPQVPEYSIHDISRIGASKKKLESLVERQIFDLNDIPDDMKLSDIQWNQVRAHRSSVPMISTKDIGEELSHLKFPLYFLDYETFAPAITIFDGYRPYQRIPFQFSLHILKEPSGELSQIEYLHRERTDPSKAVAKLLKESILPGGTIIAWNKSFEAGVNREIGLRLPDYQETFEGFNNMLYDLRDIFQKQHYVHHGFRGSTSIKKVLPAIAPELHYKNLDIQDGGQASDAWWTMVSPTTSPEESIKIGNDLIVYCGFDTNAMYEIWKHLHQLP
jgi:hypothetical protein